MPRPVITKPASLRVTPGGLLRAQRVAADEVGAVQLHDPAEARLERRGLVVEVVAVERQPRLEAQRVARAQAHGLAADGGGGLEQRGPTARAASPARAEDLEAVLAGVAGAGDPDRRRPRPRASARTAKRAQRRRAATVVSGASACCGRVPGRRSGAVSSEASSIVARRCPTFSGTSAKSLSMFAALTTIRKCSAADAVDDQVVDDAARRAGRPPCRARAPSARRADVVGDQALHRLGGARRRGSGPRPCGRRRRRRPRVRVARCSSRIPLG